jgi:uncharacterized lipoprotein
MRSVAQVGVSRAAVAACCACAAVASLSGCAMMMEMRPAADSYTYDLGVAPAPEIRAKASDILLRYGYHLVRDDGYPSLHMESQWQSRAPIDEVEKIRGYEIISRVTMTGAPRDVSGALMYHVLMTVENRFVPVRGTARGRRQSTSSAGYARSIVREMNVAFGGPARPVVNGAPPF